MENKEVASLQEKANELTSRVESVLGKVKELEEMKSNLIAGGSLMVGSRSNSIESNAISAFGCSSLKELLVTNVADRRFAHVPNEYKLNVIDLKKSLDIARMISQRFYGEQLDREVEGDFGVHLKSLTSHYFGKHMLAPRLKAYGSTTVGAGDEWVPTLIASSYIEEYELEKKVCGLFKNITMLSNPFNLPVQTGVTTAKLVAEGATASAVNFTTAAISLSAKKAVEFHELPEELNEDSAAPIMELIRAELIKAQQRACETSVLNGDDSVSHQDSDVTAASDFRKAYKGLRKLALANSANGSVVTFSSAVTKAKLDEMRQAMGKHGVNPRELAWIFSPQGYAQALATDEVTSVDKFGPQATILTGALSAYRGIPVVVSEFMREDLNVSGVYDGVTTNNTCVLLVNKERFYMGQKRPIKIKIQPNLPQIDSWLMASYQRIAFAGHTQGAAEVSVVIGIDVTAS